MPTNQNVRARKALQEFEKQLQMKMSQKNAHQNELYLHKQFKYFDIQNRGAVNFDQFRRAAEKIGVVMDEFSLQMVFKYYDKSGDGELDYKEFSSIFVNQERSNFHLTGYEINDEDTGDEHQKAYVDHYLQEKEQRHHEAQAQKKDSPMALLNLFKDKLKARGARGMVGLQRIFKLMDDDQSGSLNEREFAKACKDFRIGISEENIPALFSLFDKNMDKTIDYEEFINIVRGQLNPQRLEAVKQAFAALDANHNGVLDMKEIEGSYNAHKHPDVIQGKRTEQNVLNEFIETLEAHHSLKASSRNVAITLDEFIDYYTSISASIDEDSQFAMIVKNPWDLQATSFRSKYEQSWANGDDQSEKYSPQKEYRKAHTAFKPQAVYRSGMGSAQNPLNHTNDYYPSTKSAARGNLSSVMHGKPTYDPEHEAMRFDEDGQMAGPTKSDLATYKKLEAPEQDPRIFIKGPKPVPKFQGILVQRFRKALRARGGRGIIGLKRQFKIFDDNNNGLLEYGEFEKAIKDFGVEIEDQDIRNLFKSMDLDANHSIDFNEFLRVVVGDMTPARQALVEKAFRTLDANNNGSIGLEEIKSKYNAHQHPDVKSGKRTEEEVLIEFMETFQHHCQLLDKSQKLDDQITFPEFLEYYQHISSNIENDSYFDLMMSNCWDFDGASNPNNMPYAGVSKKVARVNPREAYLNDHHRNLFGTDNKTPFIKGGKSHMQSSNYQGEPEAWGFNQGMPAGGVNTHTKTSYRGVDYAGVQHSDDELIQKLRKALAARGARGIIGLQRIFKIIDDDRSGNIDIQEFWKAMQDFKVKISQAEARQLFDLFDQDDNGVMDYDELLRNIKGPMNDRRKTIVKRVYDRLDIDHNGVLEVSDIKKKYNADSNPDVKAGKKTSEEVLMEFLETFEAHHELNKDQMNKRQLRDGKVTLSEFLDYYSNVSASIDNDDYFELMISNAFNLNNKTYAKGWGAEF